MIYCTYCGVYSSPEYDLKFQRDSLQLVLLICLLFLQSGEDNHTTSSPSSQDTVKKRSAFEDLTNVSVLISFFSVVLHKP